MLLRKEWKEAVPQFALCLLAIVAVSQIRWEAWRPELFEFQYWAVVVLCLPFILMYSGASAIAGEREERTIEFLFARPASLAKVMLIKYTLRVVLLVLLLSLLLALFQLLRPTHNLNLHEVFKSLVIFFAFLLYGFSVSFCFSCFVDTPAKAFVSSLMFLCGTILVLNATPFFRYAWLWGDSLEDLWLKYLCFYGFLSLVALIASGILMKKKVVASYEWKHVGLIAVLFFLLFIRSVSTTFWLIPQIAYSGDLELVSLARAPMEEVLLFLAQEKENQSGSRLLRAYLRSSTGSGIDRELTQALRHPDARVRNEAVKLLTARENRSARAEIFELMNDPDEGVRHSALAYLQTQNMPELIPKVIPLLNDSSASVRQRAIMAVAAAGGKAAAPFIVPMLRDRNPRVCATAASRLCEMDYVDARPELEELLLRHPADFVRQSVAISLRNLKSAPARDALMKALLDENPRVSEYAAVSLGELGCKEAVQPLMDLISTAPERRFIAAGALAKIAAPEAKEGLKELFWRPDLPPYLRREVAFSLAKIGDEDMLKYLRSLLRMAGEDPSATAREHAIRLCKAGDYAAIPYLISYLEKGVPQQRHECGQVLTKLTGKHYGWDAEKWKKWWEKNKDDLLSPKKNTMNGGGSS